MTRRVMWHGAAIVLGLVTAALGLVVGAMPAQAHAQLVSTRPASGQALTFTPATVQLVFNGRVLSLGLQFQVIGPGGLASTGPPSIEQGTVTQPLAASLPNGGYVVNWHVVHDDGHPDQGSFTFTLDVAGGPVATSSSGTPITAAAATPQYQGNGGGTSGFGPDTPQGLPPLVVIAGVVLIVFVVGVALIADRRRRHPASH